MSDRIDRIVDKTSEYTRALLSIDASQWPAAREGLERILDNLARSAPRHAALRRLRRLIDDLSLLYDGDGRRN